MECCLVDVEWEMDDMKKVEFMVDKVGEVFNGIISFVINFGMFVELENMIEGLVYVSDLIDDYYCYDECYYVMIGEKMGNVFWIGDEIEVKVVDVNKDECLVDFIIVGMKESCKCLFKDCFKVIKVK